MKILARLVSNCVVAGLLAFLSWGLVASWLAKGIGSSEVASWVQAFGAVGAIGGAVYLMHAQRRLQGRLEETERQTLRANLLLVAIMCGQETYEAFVSLDDCDVDSSNATLQVAQVEFVSVRLRGTLAYAESAPFWHMSPVDAIKFAMIRQSCRSLIGALSGAQVERDARNVAPSKIQMLVHPRVRGDRIFASVRTGLAVLPDLIEGLRLSYKTITGADAPG